jgi:hypothetical protein
MLAKSFRRAAQNIALDYKDVPIEADYVNQIKAIAGIEEGKVKMVKCTSCAWHRSN